MINTIIYVWDWSLTSPSERRLPGANLRRFIGRPESRPLLLIIPLNQLLSPVRELSDSFVLLGFFIFNSLFLCIFTRKFAQSLFTRGPSCKIFSGSTFLRGENHYPQNIFRVTVPFEIRDGIWYQLSTKTNNVFQEEVPK